MELGHVLHCLIAMGRIGQFWNQMAGVNLESVALFERSNIFDRYGDWTRTVNRGKILRKGPQK
jgi:hypothetical protein